MFTSLFLGLQSLRSMPIENGAAVEGLGYLSLPRVEVLVKNLWKLRSLSDFLGPHFSCHLEIWILRVVWVKISLFAALPAVVSFVFL